MWETPASETTRRTGLWKVKKRWAPNSFLPLGDLGNCKFGKVFLSFTHACLWTLSMQLRILGQLLFRLNRS